LGKEIWWSSLKREEAQVQADRKPKTKKGAQKETCVNRKTETKAEVKKDRRKDSRT
jgi:hypothetical protein